MNDPRVEWLWYQIKTNSVVYLDPPPVVGETPEFRVTLENGRATAEMLADYPTIEEARTAVEPYLHAWEIHAAATFRGTAEPLRFEFEKGHVVDRAPDPDHALRAKLVGSRTVRASAAIALSAREYPTAPEGFVVSPDVETMWNRWQGYRSGRESLQGMANYCLTVFENTMIQQAAASGQKFGKRAARTEAATEYGIDLKVLSTLGDLVSEVGDPLTRRKEHAKHKRPLTGTEIRWIEDVVKAMIHRAGERAASPNRQFRALTLADFPSI
jgi:hypothetical protein